MIMRTPREAVCVILLIRRAYMRRKRIVKQISCAVLAGALVAGQIFGSGSSLITAEAAESWVDTLSTANGDFELGDYTGWTISGGDALTYTVKTSATDLLHTAAVRSVTDIKSCQFIRILYIVYTIHNTCGQSKLQPA